MGGWVRTFKVPFPPAYCLTYLAFVDGPSRDPICLLPQDSWRLFKEWSREQRRAKKRPAVGRTLPEADDAAGNVRPERLQKRKGAGDGGADAPRMVAAPTAANAAAAAAAAAVPAGTPTVKATANAAEHATRHRSADVPHLLPVSVRGAAAASAAMEAAGHHASGRGVTEPAATSPAAAGPGACFPAAAASSRLLAQLRGRLDPDAAAVLGDAVRELAADAAGAADRAPVRG